MKYIKSDGGYFYKIYSNGKKKRISKEEFMKHNKKSKKKSFKKYKMKGGEISETLRQDILNAIEEVLNSHSHIPRRTRISLEDFDKNDIRIDDPYEYLKDVINKVLVELKTKYESNNNVRGILLSLTNEELLEQVLEKIPTKTATALKPLGVHSSFNGRQKYLLSEQGSKNEYLSIKKGHNFNYKLWGTNKNGIPRIRVHHANYGIENIPNNQYVSVISKNKNQKLINVIKLDDSHPTPEQDLGKKHARIAREQKAYLTKQRKREQEVRKLQEEQLDAMMTNQTPAQAQSVTNTRPNTSDNERMAAQMPTPVSNTHAAMPNAVTNITQIEGVVCLIPLSQSSQYVDNRPNHIKANMGTTVLSREKSNCTHNCYEAYHLIKDCEKAIIADLLSPDSLIYPYNELWINILLRGKELFSKVEFQMLDIRELDSILVNKDGRQTILDDSTITVGSILVYDSLSIDDFIVLMETKKFAIFNTGGETILIYKLNVINDYLYFISHHCTGFYLVKKEAFRSFLQEQQYFMLSDVEKTVDFSSKNINAM